MKEDTRIEKESRIFYFSRNNNLKWEKLQNKNYIFFLYIFEWKNLYLSLDPFRDSNCSKVFTKIVEKLSRFSSVLVVFKKKSANAAVNITRNVSNLQLKSNAYTLFKKKRKQNWKQKSPTETSARLSRSFSSQRYNGLLSDESHDFERN